MTRFIYRLLYRLFSFEWPEDFEYRMRLLDQQARMQTAIKYSLIRRVPGAWQEAEGWAEYWSWQK